MNSLDSSGRDFMIDPNDHCDEYLDRSGMDEWPDYPFMDELEAGIVDGFLKAGDRNGL